MHVIDKVLLPPEQSTKDYISNEPELRALSRLIVNMNQSLHSLMESHSKAYTWFLPNNKAVQAYIKQLGYDTTGKRNGIITSAIEDCLMNQYVGSPLILTDDIPRNGIALTFGKVGKKIKVRKEENKKQHEMNVKYLIGADDDSDPSTLVRINEVTVNGIVHVVDRMFCD